MKSHAYLFYRYLSTVLFWLIWPFVKLYSFFNRNSRESLNQRLGSYPKKLVEKKRIGPKIWLHAASVGEVSVATVIVGEIFRLLPKADILISTTTHTGQEFAKVKCPSSVDLIYAPVDAVYAVRKALSAIKPELMVCIETEIWPNWFWEASRLGIKTMLANGRISVRSVKQYLKISSLMGSILNSVAAFSMIHADDADRIAMLGAPKTKILVNGNAKYDSLIQSHAKFQIEDFLNLYSLSGEEIIFLAGSTRQNEEEAVLDAYEKILEMFPQTLLFIAPRHIERARAVLKLALSRGHNCQLRSRFNGVDKKRTASLVIMDTIGELAAVYGLATVSFCGGSLVPLGGQNLLEAAVWGTPVFYGPSMEDFKEARQMIETVAGENFLVRNAEELAQKAIYYMHHSSERKAMGEKIRLEVLKHQGAAKKHAEQIINLLV